MTASRGFATTKLSSSLRTRHAEESLPLAQALALSRGVSRVTDTTWLDRIGIPVYASIRPDAHPDSLCVHAGKGYTHAEAKIGAYMEAIEFSFAEPGRSRVTHELVRPRDILDSFKGHIQFLDFCPRVDCAIQPTDVLAAVTAEEIFAGLGPVLVPAELVYSPFDKTPGAQVYATNTNGLASGNTVEEATVHALSEVIERDVHSFEILGAPSQLVATDSLPPMLREMVHRIEAAGLEFYLRYCPNEFGLPHFIAYALEPVEHEYVPLAAMSGVGLHPNSDIAAVRAIAEVAQGRLTTIHGGRDDLISKHLLADSLGKATALSTLLRLKARVVDASSTICFEDVPTVGAASIEEALEGLYAGMRRVGLRHVARVVYTESDYPFQVVRVIVPGAEFYDHRTRRVGPRLINWFKARQAGTA